MREEIERSLAKMVDRRTSYQQCSEELFNKMATYTALGLLVGVIMGLIVG